MHFLRNVHWGGKSRKRDENYENRDIKPAQKVYYRGAKGFHWYGKQEACWGFAPKVTMLKDALFYCNLQYFGVENNMIVVDLG